MTQKPISEQPTEELQKNKSRMQGLIIAGGFIWLVLAGVLLYKQFYLSKPIISFLPMLIVLPITYIGIFKNLAVIKAELKTRK